MSEKENLDKILALLDKFPWGTPVQAHTIGDYALVEFVDSDDGETAFCSYVQQSNGSMQDTHMHSTTLDQALIDAIAYKYDGVGSRANIYIERLLEMNKND